MAKIHEGYLSREMLSGPFEREPLVLDGPEGKTSLDLLLRSSVGAYVRIIIEPIKEPNDAKLKRLENERNSKYSRDRGRGY